MNWRIVQGVSCNSPYHSWDSLDDHDHVVRKKLVWKIKESSKRKIKVLHQRLRNLYYFCDYSWFYEGEWLSMWSCQKPAATSTGCKMYLPEDSWKHSSNYECKISRYELIIIHLLKKKSSEKWL